MNFVKFKDTGFDFHILLYHYLTLCLHGREVLMSFSMQIKQQCACLLQGLHAHGCICAHMCGLSSGSSDQAHG